MFLSCHICLVFMFNVAQHPWERRSLNLLEKIDPFKNHLFLHRFEFKDAKPGETSIDRVRPAISSPEGRFFQLFPKNHRLSPRGAPHPAEDPGGRRRQATLGTGGEAQRGVACAERVLHHPPPPRQRPGDGTEVDAGNSTSTMYYNPLKIQVISVQSK